MILQICDNPTVLSVMRIVNIAILIIKIVVPILLIVYGMLDVGKAVVGSKDDEIKKSAKTLMYRAIAGIVIFFVPSLVVWLFQTVGSFNDAANATNFDDCKKCILTPWSC